MPYKNSFVYPCPNNRLHMFIGIGSFHMKTLVQRIYTSKIPEHWLFASITAAGKEGLFMFICNP
jgi:hypothetical protein